MSRIDYGAEPTPPPGFEDARNLRQQARAAGMNPNYWYAVELDSNIEPGEVHEVVFWKRSFALFRDERGELHAIENRCAHRHLKLSEGEVKGCQLICPYHGWTYDGDGRLARVPHNDFGKTLNLKLRHFPVKVRYGLVFLFPGDPELAETRRIPDIPELEGPDRWVCVPLEYTWHGHHSMIIDNVSDLTHGYLHRKWRPFYGDELVRVEETDDRVLCEYKSKIGAGRFMDIVIDRSQHAGDRYIACYDYPYHWSNIEEFVKHFLCVLPIDERTSRIFFLVYYRHFKVPFLPLEVPRRLMEPLVRFGQRYMVDPLFQEDGWAVAQEQIGWERHWNEPLAEPNPVVRAFQRLTVRKWQEHLDEASGRQAHVSTDRLRKAPSSPGTEAAASSPEASHG